MITKNRSKLLAIAIAATMGVASPVMANSSDSFLSDIAEPKVQHFEQEATITESEPTAQSAPLEIVDGDRVTFSSKDAIEASRKFTELQQTLKTLKVELDIATTRNALSDSENASRVEKFQKENEALTLELKDVEKEFVDAMQRISTLESENRNLKQQLNLAEEVQSQSHVFDEIYLLRIEGFGDNLEAKIYLNNDIMIIKPGDYISDKIYLDKVQSDYVVVSNGSKSKRLRVTTHQRAYDRTVGLSGDSDQLIGNTPFPQ